jgi:hypothetical protein
VWSTHIVKKNLKHWDYSLVQHDDISVVGPIFRRDLGQGDKVCMAFVRGRNERKKNSHINPFKGSKELTDAFWMGWEWEKNYVG